MLTVDPDTIRWIELSGTFYGTSTIILEYINNTIYSTFDQTSVSGNTSMFANYTYTSKYIYTPDYTPLQAFHTHTVVFHLFCVLPGRYLCASAGMVLPPSRYLGAFCYHVLTPAESATVLSRRARYERVPGMPNDEFLTNQRWAYY